MSEDAVLRRRQFSRILTRTRAITADLATDLINGSAYLMRTGRSDLLIIEGIFLGGLINVTR